MENNSFNKISEALNTTFIDSEKNNIDKQISIIEDKKNDVVKTLSDKKVLALEDQEYLRRGVKDLITATTRAYDILCADLKIGSPGRSFECLARLAESLMIMYKELRELNCKILDLSIMSGTSELDKPKQTENIQMSSTQLMELITKAKNESQLNAIEADFKIEDEDK